MMSDLEIKNFSLTSTLQLIKHASQLTTAFAH